MALRVLTIVGARPQFIKAAALSRAIRALAPGAIEEQILHTGQHFDANMSQVFFDEMEIPKPAHHLGISGGTHGAMTGRMLEGIEKVMLSEKPDWVLIYGDTNSTLAGALAAAKLHIPVAHVEAGLRSFNMRMPEEVNRILADRVSTLLLCPTESAVKNLAAEGTTRGVHNTGDVMYDVALHYRAQAKRESRLLESLGLAGQPFVLATCHRAENTDDPARLGAIVGALGDVARQMPVVLPLHPRTRKFIDAQGLRAPLGGVRLVEPLSFLDMVALEQAARLILTDSGGVQKEAFFYCVPCLTMRDETEWVETTRGEANVLVGADRGAILERFARLVAGDWKPDFSAKPYGDGRAAAAILEKLLAVVK